MQVIPPGMDFSNVIPHEDNLDADGELTPLASSDGSSPRAIPAIWSEVCTRVTWLYIINHQFV